MTSPTTDKRRAAAIRTGDNAVTPAQRCARDNSTITIAGTQSSAGIF